jgi:hypothetical protein
MSDTLSPQLLMTFSSEAFLFFSLPFVILIIQSARNIRRPPQFQSMPDLRLYQQNAPLNEVRDKEHQPQSFFFWATLAFDFMLPE